MKKVMHWTLNRILVVAGLEKKCRFSPTTTLFHATWCDPSAIWIFRSTFTDAAGQRAQPPVPYLPEIRVPTLVNPPAPRT
jgi:hypothetical protein